MSKKTETRVFATAEEARAHQPADKPGWHLFQVTGTHGESFWTWSGGHGTALVTAAQAAGWKAVRADKAPTKDKVADLLAQLPEAERAALLAKYAGAPTPAPAAAPAPAPEKPAGKGKGSK
jgi:hypothetical protein